MRLYVGLMRLATVALGRNARPQPMGRPSASRSAGDLTSLLHTGADPRRLALGEPVDGIPAAPVAPGKVAAIGLNYLDHIRESGSSPASPWSSPSSPPVSWGPATRSACRRGHEAVDWEVELAVVIGRRAARSRRRRALEYVFGYTVANDVSARDVQLADGQWVRAKSIDTFCPLGPVVVTADEIPDPQALHLVCRVNGEVMQDSTTAEMVFGVAELISVLLSQLHARPRGRPAHRHPVGVRRVHGPPALPGPGDVVETEIDGIGAPESLSVVRRVRRRSCGPVRTALS